MESGKATVKSVLSGDLIVLFGKAINGPPPEIVFSLSSVFAPRLQTSTTCEEPFGWQAREFLRTLLVSKNVEFNVEYISPKQRHVGTIKMPLDIEGTNDVAKLLVLKGFARVKLNSGQKDLNLYQQELTRLEKTAQEKESGQWNKQEQPLPRKVAFDWQQEQDPRQFITLNKGVPIPAIIEQFLTGSRFRALLILSPTNHQSITGSFSGISCPEIQESEPFSLKAKFFVETRLLQKNVHVLLESIDPNKKTFFCTLVHPSGLCIAQTLLKEGLARIKDWNLAIVQNPEAYKSAQQIGMTKKLGIWTNLIPNQANFNQTKYLGLVTRIVGSDSLIVETESKHLQKVFLSSIRGPKRLKNEAGAETGYYTDAFEFLRNRLVGSRVTVQLDYIKPKEGEYEQRNCVTIIKNDKNIAEVLVSKGLASVIKHRKDDNNRSPFYDLFLQAEEEAVKLKVGIHSKNEAPVYRIVDASENPAKAKSFFLQFQRQSSIKGIVEYIWSGSRFKIWIPTLNCKLTFVLSAVCVARTPTNARDRDRDRQVKGQEQVQGQDEPFGIEAFDFVTKKIFQQQVEIKVESQDTRGTAFIGSLTFGSPPTNIAIALLEQGLAKVHEYSASHNTNSAALFAAEALAKNRKAGLWESYDPDAKLAENAQEALDINPKTAPSVEVLVTEVTDQGKVFLQYVGPELQNLAKLMVEFSEFHETVAAKSIAPPLSLKVGDYCSAQYSLDKKWYRARIVKILGKMYHVTHIDYGNSEQVDSGSSIRALGSLFSVSKLGPQAKEKALAYICLPEPDSEFGPMALDALRYYTASKTKLNAVAVDSLSVMLFDKDRVSVQEKMIGQGLATITREWMKKYEMDQRQRLKDPSKAFSNVDSKLQLELLVDEQVQVAKKRLNLWEYGDLGLYDE